MGEPQRQRDDVRADEQPLLSVVIPMYNEQDALPLLVQRLRPVLDDLDVDYEALPVDDGSADTTPTLLRTLADEWPELRIIRLMRNSGHQAALSAGLSRARGRYVVTIDADLQDPPEIIPAMLREALTREVDVVYAVRTDRSTDSWAKRWTAERYYRLARRLAGEQVPENAGDYRLMSRRVVDAVNGLPDVGRVYRLAVPWFGFPSSRVEYAREKRAAGRTKYSVPAMARLAVDSITSFSAAPLRIATWLGLVGMAVCLGLVVYVVTALLSGTAVPGWASTLLIVATLGAVQLLSLGLLGEYIGRLFERSQGRPSYLIAYDSQTPAQGLDRPEDERLLDLGGRLAETTRHDEIEHPPELGNHRHRQQ